MEITLRALARCDRAGCYRSAEVQEQHDPRRFPTAELFQMHAEARFYRDGWKIDKYGCKCPDHN